MRFLKTFLAAALLCLLPFAVQAEAIDAAALVPIEMTAEAEGQVLDLYCGPTQGFYRQDGQTLDTGKPYVLFGQYDCWAMAAQGTKDAFGPVGWVEAGSITDIPYQPQLGFEDGFAAMIEETAPMTDNPFAENPLEGWSAALEPGTSIIVLAQLDGWLYVQSEIDGTPVRAFIQAATVF